MKVKARYIVCGEVKFCKEGGYKKPVCVDCAGLNKNCPVCGKRMHEVVDSIAKKKTGHLWRCSCMPVEMRISIG